MLGGDTLHPEAVRDRRRNGGDVATADEVVEVAGPGTAVDEQLDGPRRLHRVERERALLESSDLRNREFHLSMDLSNRVHDPSNRCLHEADPVADR